MAKEDNQTKHESEMDQLLSELWEASEQLARKKSGLKETSSSCWLTAGIGRSEGSYDFGGPWIRQEVKRRVLKYLDDSIQKLEAEIRRGCEDMGGDCLKEEMTP